MVPDHEVDLKDIQKAGKKGELEIVSVGTVEKLREWQRQSAVLHWEIMNTVVPLDVWTLY